MPRPLPVVLLALFAPACRGAGHDFEFSASGLHLEEAGTGLGVALAQTIARPAGHALDLELGFELVPLDAAGPLGDEWKRVWAGTRWRRADGRGPRAFLGITWLRTDAAVQGLEEFGDYGGGSAALGYAFALAPGVLTGPELVAAWLDSEGDRAGSGAFVEFAWRIVFCL